jgi:hypothetical protein
MRIDQICHLNRTRIMKKTSTRQPACFQWRLRNVRTEAADAAAGTGEGSEISIG